MEGRQRAQQELDILPETRRQIELQLDTLQGACFNAGIMDAMKQSANTMEQIQNSCMHITASVCDYLLTTSIHGPLVIDTTIQSKGRNAQLSALFARVSSSKHNSDSETLSSI